MSESKLFTPLKVGAVTVPNRVFMAPLTRLRSIEPGDIPTPLMGEYYRQRAGTDCRMEKNHRRRTRGKRAYCRSAVAHRAHFAQQHPAGWRRAGCTIGH